MCQSLGSPEGDPANDFLLAVGIEYNTREEKIVIVIKHGFGLSKPLLPSNSIINFNFPLQQTLIDPRLIKQTPFSTTTMKNFF